nr:MAG TPA: adenine-specific methyltransferase [Caudoviricetes sp.]
MMEKYIKSPMNYTGGKGKLLNQILPLFPKNINTFVDLFTGGCNVAVNVNANKIIANDLCTQVIDTYKGIQNNTTEENIKMIEEIIDKYDLSKENREGYLELRKAYNDGNKEWHIFYTLLAYSFNNQIRFNKKGEFNMPFGKGRSSFNPTLKKKFEDFSNAIHNKNIKFTNNDFKKLNIDKLKDDDFVYLDPPYLVTEATYNTGWNEETEKELLSLCDRLNEKGIKFAISNVLEHNGSKNEILINWSKNYNVNYLNYDYSNCNYHKKDNGHKSIEVLITNYKNN